ncbi:MAG: hypothetical protein JWO57_3185, partial [Pseudonocardiales bacterium]|nr:hypothetical protein [Pseudonocardiales bacterium]
RPWSRRRVATLAASACVAVLTGCSSGHSAAKNLDTGPLTITSTFKANGLIPISYSCAGTNTSPPLSWHGIAPAGTKSWAIVMQDLDVKPAPWVQWIVSGIPPKQRTAATGQAPAGSTTGRATNGTTGFVGACPPQGKVHHYQFTIYALSSQQPVSSSTKAAGLLHSLDTTALAKISLTGRFGR